MIKNVILNIIQGLQGYIWLLLFGWSSFDSNNLVISLSSLDSVHPIFGVGLVCAPYTL